MKRFLSSLALGVGLLTGCSDSQTVPTAAGLAGTYDVTIVGDYVFVTSSDRNELRVLDLNASPRDFVRAPNPLEPLSIPVLDRPLSLTRDLRYGTTVERDSGGDVTGLDLGQEYVGPYIYARSAGSAEISVVAAAPEYFKEVERLEVEGFVTAFAARGPREGEKSVLYYATQDTGGATLRRMELPGPEVLAETDGSSEITREVELALPDEVVTALLVLPPLETPPGQVPQEHIVVATRKISKDPNLPGRDRTFRWDVAAGRLLVNYQFGAPVRLLATHPRIENTEFLSSVCPLDELEKRSAPVPAVVLDAGARVFGVLDESACGGQPVCSGVLAVDAFTGQVAKDSTDKPMFPISVSPALPTGLTLAPSSVVTMRCLRRVGTAEPPEFDTASELQQRPLLGIVPASNGQITFFDAVKLQQFDLSEATASTAGIALLNAAGQQRATRGDLSYFKVEVLEGVTQDNTFRVIYEGLLADLAGLTRNDAACTVGTAPGTCFPVDPGAAAKVEVGDLLILEGDTGACGAPLLVAEKQDNGARLATTSPIPEECAELPRFSVRAGGSRPFAVYADAGGYQGRMGEGAGQGLTLSGGYFFNPLPPTALEPAPYRVRFTLNATEPDLVRGDQYTVTTLSGFVNFVFAVDTDSLAAGLTTYRLPGPVVHTEVEGADLAYIAYPSADGLLQVNLGSIQDNTANSRGLVPFE